MWLIAACVRQSAMTILTATSSMPFTNALYTTPESPAPIQRLLPSEFRQMWKSTLSGCGSFRSCSQAGSCCDYGTGHAAYTAAL